MPGDGTEVFIIDNASSDGSCNFLEPLFPDFHFIRNKENSGFSKANNLVIPLCKGDFILFLNPDTILAEDSLDICISFIRDHADAGAVVSANDRRSRTISQRIQTWFPFPCCIFF
ncbi:MAG: glycosyltransferase [Puia sp.]